MYNVPSSAQIYARDAVIDGHTTPPSTKDTSGALFGVMISERAPHASSRSDAAINPHDALGRAIAGHAKP